MRSPLPPVSRSLSPSLTVRLCQQDDPDRLRLLVPLHRRQRPVPGLPRRPALVLPLVGSAALDGLANAPLEHVGGLQRRDKSRRQRPRVSRFSFDSRCSASCGRVSWPSPKGPLEAQKENGTLGSRKGEGATEGREGDVSDVLPFTS